MYPKSKDEHNRLTRLDIAKQLFHALLNRMQAYNFAKAMGLVLFGTKATLKCSITPLFQKFKEHSDAATCE
jgi:hypothetical protein